MSHTPVLELSNILLGDEGRVGRGLSHMEGVDLDAEDQIKGYVAHSWYNYIVDKSDDLHPYRGEKNLHYSDPRLTYAHLEVDASYFWFKSPRGKGKSVEVDPLACMFVRYAHGNSAASDLVDSMPRTLDLPLQALYWALGRTAARTAQTKRLVGQIRGWYDQLVAHIKASYLETFNAEEWTFTSWPSQAKGVGVTKALGGALAHRLAIKDGLIDNHQAVVPSTWIATPRGAAVKDSFYQTALNSTHMADDVQQPIEIVGMQVV